MKLRIRGNSIRLRLSKTETGIIADGKPVSDCTDFPGSARLTYVLQPSPASSGISASLADHRLIVSVPLASAIQWAKGDEVALKSHDSSFPILVEKDFTCLKPRSNESEDEGDLFPNPNLQHGHCT